MIVISRSVIDEEALSVQAGHGSYDVTI